MKSSHYLAGAAAATVATPSEAVPVYMQCMEKAGTPKTSMQAFKELKLQVWRGFSLTAGRDGLFTMGYGSLAALAKARATQAYGDSPVVSVGSGALTGGAIAVATQPLAVVKTMLQGDPFGKTYANSFDAAKSLYQQDGMRGFFRGMSGRGPRIVLAIPVLNKAEELYAGWVTSRTE